MFAQLQTAGQFSRGKYNFKFYFIISYIKTLRILKYFIALGLRLLLSGASIESEFPLGHILWCFNLLAEPSPTMEIGYI